ncbi:MAG: hypothetical protein J0L84_00760 [Verrucomicrobia bacterium]|nr:hypothetical protein [Verrucomicrobiota bacterium]
MKPMGILIWVAGLVACLLRAAEPPGSPGTVPPLSWNAGPREFDSPTRLNDVYTHDFATRPGFGQSRILTLPPQDFLTWEGRRYRILRPDLLGLTGKPTAYQVPFDFPTAADLSSQELRRRMSKRPLNTSEQRAVVRLQGGEPWVLTSDDLEGRRGSLPVLESPIRLVGALRAQSRCLSCHAVAEGTLLGALSYIGEPVDAAATGLAALAKLSLEP